MDERLRLPGAVSPGHFAEPLPIEPASRHRARQRFGEILARSSRLVGVLEEIDDEPLRRRPARERDPAKDVAAATEVEGSRALGVVDEGHREEGRRPEAQGVQKVNEAYQRLLKSDVKYRFSIDMASLKSP
jgi:hypothetical protein